MSLKKIIDNQPWWFWIISFISFLFVFNNKSYYLGYVIFATLVFWVKQDSLLTLGYTLLLAIPFEKVVRSWPFEVVAYGPSVINIGEGYGYYFGVTIKMIAILGLFLITLTTRKHKTSIVSSNIYSWLIILILLFATISSIYALRFDLAVTGLARLWLGFNIFLFGQYFFKSGKIKHFDKYLSSLLLFLGLIGTLQFLNQQALGLTIEDLNPFLPLGFTTSDGVETFRVLGIMSHPTQFGSFLCLLLPVPIGLFIREISTKKTITWTVLFSGSATLLGLISIIGTYSRSAWLTTAFIIIIFSLRLKGIAAWIKLLRVKIFQLAILFIMIVFVLLLPNILQRVDSIGTVWSLGSGRGRLYLAKQSFQMMQNSPLFGVGLNHYTQALVDLGVESEFGGFINPVHNTFLLFLSEIGIPAGLAFILFVLLLLQRSWPKIKGDWINFSIWVGAATFLINAQFHTLFNTDPTFDMFMLMLGYLSVLLWKNK